MGENLIHLTHLIHSSINSGHTYNAYLLHLNNIMQYTHVAHFHYLINIYHYFYEEINILPFFLIQINILPIFCNIGTCQLVD